MYDPHAPDPAINPGQQRFRGSRPVHFAELMTGENLFCLFLGRRQVDPRLVVGVCFLLERLHVTLNLLEKFRALFRVRLGEGGQIIFQILVIDRDIARTGGDGHRCREGSFRCCGLFRVVAKRVDFLRELDELMPVVVQAYAREREDRARNKNAENKRYRPQ